MSDEHHQKSSGLQGSPYKAVILDPVFHVASNEFSMLMDQPLTFIVALVILVFAVVYAAYNSIAIPQVLSADNDPSALINFGMENMFWYTTLFCSFLSLCVGIISISDDRSNGSIRILLTKPLYRRDIVAGKFVGGSLFLIVTVIATLLVSVSATLITYRGPVPYADLTIRTVSYSLLLSVYCILTLCIAMLIGAFFKDLSLALVASFSYLYFGLVENVYFSDLGSLSIINPYSLYWSAFSTPLGKSVFDTSGPYTSWLSSAMPYIALLLLEIFIVFLLVCAIFNKEEA